MFGRKASSGSDAAADLAALGRSLAIIEFDPTGTILTANENFCAAMGYTLPEMQGRHHSMFVDPDFVGSAEYKAFWAKLGRGEYDAREYKRIGKGGSEVWIQASYNPVTNAKGKVVKVIKQATVITAEKLRNVEFAEHDQCDLTRAGDDRVHPQRRSDNGQPELSHHVRLQPR